MSENTSNQTQPPQNSKPVNINISFNISRKQVTQNINSIDHENPFNFKNTNIEENPTTNLKPKMHSSRPLKTPELAQTDRHIYSKELQYPRATQELKRKKRKKRNSVDDTNDKNTSFPFCPVDLDKSLPTHKRGYTTTIMKKTQSGTKNKKQLSKTNQNIKQNDMIPISSILNQGSKNDGKSTKLQKNLKTILNKLINNELSKRSLPLPSVPSKSKCNQSTALTSKKISSARPSKKRPSKSHIMTKEKVNSASNINNSSSSRQIFENSQLLEKLENFRSIQNSILVSEGNQCEDNQQYGNKQKNHQQKRIVIKTDQSIECIGEIHDWERNFYQEQFFQQDTKKLKNNYGTKKQQQKDTSSKTLSLIETYVKLLNSSEQQFYAMGQQKLINSKVPNNINEKVQIYEEGDDYMQMSLQDVNRSRERLNLELNKPKYHELGRDEDGKSLVDEIQNVFKRGKSDREVEEKYGDYKRQSDFQLQRFQNNEVPILKPQKKQYMQEEDFKPFMSSQMGREIHYSASNTEQRQKLNELKKHQIQKWSCLLDYIKSNINSETSTQEVLQQVYDYLSKAKVDLIKQGQNITMGQGQSKSRTDFSNFTNKQKLQEEFTNKLSSQIQKSSPEIKLERTQSEDIELNSYEKSQQFHSNKKKLGQLMRSEEQQILDQETKSFKQDYESSHQEESMKFMNLSTIQTALKNRFNQLCTKKDKQIQQLDSLYEDKKISSEEYQKQKSELEILFKKQTNEILMVKKNIWKGYNEAKGILDKSYITSRVQEQFGSMMYGGSDRKDKKMMKCLSESYLNKKKIDYKKFIEEEERKKEHQEQHHTYKSTYKRQNGQQQESSEQQPYDEKHHFDEQQHKKMLQNHLKDHIQRSQSDNNDYDQNSAQFLGQSGSIYEQDSAIHQQQSLESSERQGEHNRSRGKSIDDQFERIAEKMNRLKEKHDGNMAQDSIRSYVSEENSLVKQNLSINQINDFTIQDHKYPDGNNSNSPHLISASPDSSMHYEEIEKSIHAYSDSEQASEQEIHTPQSDDYQSPKSEDESQQENQEESQKSQKSFGYGKGQNKIDDESRDQHYSDDEEEEYSSEEREILDREMENDTLSQLKRNHLPPSKSSLQKLQDQDLQRSLSKENETNDEQKALAKLKRQQDPKAKALAKKLRYLTEQDRQDIVEFLFLDLCIELYQEPCHENRLMDTINRYVAKQQEMAKRKKGVKTNLNVVKDYLKRFCGYLMRTNKQALDNMNVPMGPTAIEMLKYMHENEDFDDQQGDQAEGVVTLIIPVSIFDTFERSLLPTLEFERYYDSDEKQHQRVTFLKNILHIHNKALFDALNEFLDQQRPFGIWGKPFPWKKSSSFSHKFTEIQQQQKLKKSAQKVVEACSYVCGLLVDKQQSLVGNAKISQGYVEQIRQDRISRMLANEMIENQERWVFYDDQETQVLVETSNFVFNSLLKELLKDIKVMVEKK